MTEPDPAELPIVGGPSTTDPARSQPRRRLRALPALAVASMLVAGGLLMAVGGMARLLGPVAPTPTPTVATTPVPAPTPVPTPVPSVPSANPFLPTTSPHGEVAPLVGPV